MDLDAVVKANRAALQPVAEALKRATAYTLSLPCAVVVDGTVTATPLQGLRQHLRCSMALASEPIERFLRLKDAVGFDAAFEAMSDDDEYGEEFCRQWDAAQADLANGVVATLNDLTAMAEQAKQGWMANPKRLLVVAVQGSEVTSGTVPVDWVLAA